ncbi:MAG TPA: rhomboid family intramembrane serine protease [Candidatus Bilamarchaeum sp.]|nr:rhomboid family intramembrane serine protease [Candidatus Bilamarchaeum sp.]
MISLIILLSLIAVFIVQMGSDAFTNLFIFDPLTASTEPWRFVTSIFLHGGIAHLFFNGYALFIFGSILERRISLKDYLIIFFGAGLVGSLFYYATYLLGIIPPIPALGASGAIYGILGAVAVLVPNLTVFFWFIPMPVRYAAICWFLLEFLGTFDISSGVASAAHLGGLLFGVAFALLIKSVSHEPPHWETWS